MEAGRFDDWETKIGTQVATAAAPQRQELTGRKRRRKTHLTLTGLLMEVARDSAVILRGARKGTVRSHLDEYPTPGGSKR
jgi:hypothetical protein